MFFASDNWAGASDRVRDALAQSAAGFAPAYGNDDLTRALVARLSALFERKVEVRLVPTGTAANMLALAALCPPHGVIFAHEEAHVCESECGAVEFASGGQVLGLAGDNGKLTPAALEQAMERYPAQPRFRLPSALSITQATEAGTVYSLAEIADLAAFARGRGLGLHMDGARFANAVASLGVSPAAMTWQAGVDVLSFGGTKNGALMAEAVVIFDKVDLDIFDRRRQRGGHGVSKMRPMATQFLALLDDDHWLALARHANAMAARLSAGLVEAGCRLAWPTQANEVFVTMPTARVERLWAAGAAFYDWPARGAAPDARPSATETLVRLVCSFATPADDVERFLAIAHQPD